MFVEIKKNVYYVGVDDRKTLFFENIWYIPYGISYNVYLLVDEKIALIEGGTKIEYTRELLDNISSVIDVEKIDYIIVNHMEPDHTGNLPILYKLAPNAKIVVSALGKMMLANFYEIKDSNRIIVVRDGDKISLGKMKLQFFMIPGVHWPETMVTYEVTNKILFSGDAFGSYGALNGKIFDDEIDVNFYLNEAKRYFANIVGMHASSVQNALKKLRNLEISMIAPSHGPIWRKNPMKIVELYDKLSKYESENKVLIVYGSMYGFTEEITNYIARKLAEVNVKVTVYNATFTHPGFVLGEAWDSKVILFGLPTYDNGPFPPVFYNAYFFARKRLLNKYFGIFGSSGWSGKGYTKLIDLLKPLKWKLIEPIVEIRGKAKREDFDKAVELVKNVISIIKGSQ